MITVAEADTILVAEHDVVTKYYDPDCVKAPRVLDGRVVRVAHLYNKVVVLIWDCLHICGLSKNIVIIHLKIKINQIPKTCNNSLINTIFTDQFHI